MQDVVLRVDRDESEDRVAVAVDEADDGHEDVDGAQSERVLASGVGTGAERKQAEPPCQQVDDVVPGIDVEDAEDGVDVARSAERRGVEEADDPSHDQDPPTTAAYA